MLERYGVSPDQILPGLPGLVSALGLDFGLDARDAVKVACSGLALDRDLLEALCLFRFVLLARRFGEVPSDLCGLPDDLLWRPVATVHGAAHSPPSEEEGPHAARQRGGVCAGCSRPVGERRYE